ncbi:dynamin family protein [Aspergillus heterothallicus]
MQAPASLKQPPKRHCVNACAAMICSREASLEGAFKRLHPPPIAFWFSIFFAHFYHSRYAMAVSAETEALQKLQHEQVKLLDIIDELRTIGIGSLVELPQLIVSGNQSSGKSSVLEAISRVRFPAKSNVCTRFATEIMLRRSRTPRIKIRIEPGESNLTDQGRKQHLQGFSHEAFSDGSDLPALIERAKEHMGIDETTDSGFSDDVLKVEISGPDKPELTLVDLPGLYYSTSAEQGKGGIEITRGLTKRYMANPRSIILAVISAKTDYHLQEVLDMARLYDATRQRTLGIITQPDTLEANSEEEESYLAFLNNEKVQLQLGWHALRNRSFETRDASDDARDEREKEFFNQGQWATASRECVGVDSLRHRLSKILFDHIRRSLPDLMREIQQKISDREQKLSKLGPLRATVAQQRGFLLNISSAFERITGQALNGMYADEFFGGLTAKRTADSDARLLRASIRRLNDFFAEAMACRGDQRIIGEQGSRVIPSSTGLNPYMEGWAPRYITRSELETELIELARRNRGIELPGTANQLLVGSLFRDQSGPWEHLAKEHLVKAWEAARYFVYALLRHLTDENTVTLLAGSLLEDQLERMRESLLAKLDELISYTKHGHPLPVGTNFIAQIQKTRTERLLGSLKSTLTSVDSKANSFTMAAIEQSLGQLDKTQDEFAIADVIDQMEAYYQVAIITFVNNVATLGIENCLLRPLQGLLTSQVINNMDETRIQQLASEPAYVSQERDRLTDELKRLRLGLRTFTMYRPITVPFSRAYEASA